MPDANDSIPIKPEAIPGATLNLLVDCKMLLMTTTYMQAAILARLDNITWKQAYAKVQSLNKTMRDQVLATIAGEHGDLKSMFPDVDFPES